MFDDLIFSFEPGWSCWKFVTFSYKLKNGNISKYKHIGLVVQTKFYVVGYRTHNIIGIYKNSKKNVFSYAMRYPN